MSAKNAKNAINARNETDQPDQRNEPDEPNGIGRRIDRNEIRYDSEADVLLLVLRENPPVDAIEEPGE